MTNFHVLQSALATLPRRPGGLPRAGQEGAKRPLVAKVTLLGALPSHKPDKCYPASFCMCLRGG